jgi:integrase
MALKFTDMFIRSLKPKVKEYTFREKGGFGIRIMPSGRKVFFYLYRVDGQRRFLNLGEYPDIELKEARNKYDAASAQVKLLKDGLPGGADPVQVKTEKSIEREEHRKAQTVDELITDYIEKHAMVNKKNWQEDKRILEKDALPTWGERKAKDIKKRDVVLLLESIVGRGSPGSANNNFKIIRKMFRFAVQRDIIEHSPCDGVVMPAPLNRGDRVLSEAEITALWNNLDSCHVSDEIRRAIRLILVTAQRPGEVIGMHTDEIDAHWWTIPSERSKNKKAHRVFLTDTALELIGPLIVLDEKTKEMKPKGFIFPCPNSKKKQGMAVNALAHAVRRNMAAPVLVNGNAVFDKYGKPIIENKLGIADFTPHDLRRTAATFMSQLGFMDEIIDAVLNHVKQGIIKTYNLNKYDNEKQKALEAWESKLKTIIS